MSDLGNPSPSLVRPARAFAFPLLATVLFAYFFAASTPSPLFVVFQHQWGFSSGLLTVAFSAYAITLLVALLSAGSLSDHIGRKPVIVGALLLQTLAMVLFAYAGDIQQLIFARCLQGLATGIASGALSAAVVEAAPIHQKKAGALFSSIAPLAGLATGSLITGLSMYWIGHPEVTVFVALAVVFPLAAVGVARVPETSSRRAGALASLMPRVSVTPRARSAYVRSVPLLLSIWALCGLYMSLAPSILHGVFKVDSAGLNGLTVAALCGPAAVAAAVMGRLFSPSLCAALGALGIVMGLAILIGALSWSGVLPFFVGTVVAGIGSGAGFSAVLQTLAPLADAHERAELFAAIFVACYLSLSLPPIIAGFGVGHFGLFDTSLVYLTALLIVALITGVVHWRHHRHPD
ncbi:MFS transporter [Pseudomonas sp. SLFW]|uniref:MFS transporter n=1 Tax=Pseudomonas sp. SLFW TaxID=2683259 RepID=UPI001413339E|nr:MFS transporter [Pseudomonas sp. SLFW]NBB12185.1 MFS transporter [Pseudomonas sp. SLFW]